jgi:hypothetical protein
MSAECRLLKCVLHVNKSSFPAEAFFSKLSVHQSNRVTSRYANLVTDFYPGYSAMLLMNDVL